MQFIMNITVVVFVVSTAVFVVVNNNDIGVDIDLQKGSKWANYGNMAKMNTTIKTTITTTTTMTITMTKTITTTTIKKE